eukprot:gene9134-11191_t
MSRIYGIGNDIVKISRIISSFERNGDKFLNRAFHPEEIKQFKELQTINKENAFNYLAGRWAGKESIYKALEGKDRSKLNFQNIRIFNKPSGKPYFDLLSPTNEYVKSLGVTNIHLSISHDTDYCIANVILECSADASEDFTNNKEDK